MKEDDERIWTRSLLVGDLREPVIEPNTGVVTYHAKRLPEPPGGRLGSLAAFVASEPPGGEVGAVTLFIDGLACTPNGGECQSDVDCCDSYCLNEETCPGWTCSATEGLIPWSVTCLIVTILSHRSVLRCRSRNAQRALLQSVALRPRQETDYTSGASAHLDESVVAHDPHQGGVNHRPDRHAHPSRSRGALEYDESARIFQTIAKGH
jgi:hypothetical protein